MAEGKKLPISVVISAVDNVTYKVMAINEKLKRITAPVGKVRTAFQNLGTELGLQRLGQALGRAGKTGKEFFNDLSRSVMRVAAVGAAAGAAIYGITRSFATAGDEIKTVSERLGLSTTAFQELSYAASRADVDQQQFTNAMDKFNKGIGEAAAGSGEAFVGFNALGISIRDASGRVRSMDELLPEVADKLGDIQSESVRAAVASKLFGREGAKLNGIFKEGSKGLAALREEARRVGAVMTPEQIAAAEAFDDGMKSVGATLLMVRNVIGAALAPKLVELGAKLQQYILGNQDKIAAFANAFADRLPGILSALINLFSMLGAVLRPIVGLVTWLADTFGETAVILGALAAYFAPALVSLFSFASALGSVAMAAGNVLLILAGIVGWPISLAVALGAGLVALYKFFTPFQEIVDKAFGAVQRFFGFGGGDSMALSTGGGPSMGPPVGAMKTVDASSRAGANRSENHVVVDFNNLPKGTRVETKKADGGLDLSLGYGMVN